MNIKYFGHKTERDHYTKQITYKQKPFFSITFKEKERNLAIKRLEFTGYWYDLFGVENSNGEEVITADISINSKDEKEDFLLAWKEAKKAIKN